MSASILWLVGMIFALTHKFAHPTFNLFPKRFVHTQEAPVWLNAIQNKENSMEERIEPGNNLSTKGKNLSITISATTKTIFPQQG
jgi:hypothetical protein